MVEKMKDKNSLITSLKCNLSDMGFKPIGQTETIWVHKELEITISISDTYEKERYN
jgi:hypothetical protein